MQRRTNQAIFSILAMLTIWVVIHTVKLNTIVPDYDNLVNKVNVLLERVSGVEGALKEVKEVKEAELSPFGEKFSKMRNIHGSGYLFNWGGNLYTTYYAEEMMTNNNQ